MTKHRLNPLQAVLCSAFLVGCVDAPSAPLARLTQASSQGPNRYIISVAGADGVLAVQQHAPILRRLQRASAVAAELTPAALDALLADPGILAIEPDPLRYPQASAPTSPPYGLSAVQADQISGGGMVKVCIIDSGLSAEHEALSHLTVTADEDHPVCKGNGSQHCSGSGDPFFDETGHGTHVAGTIAGVIGGIDIGVAPNNVALHIVKVFDADGFAYSSDVAHAAELCADAGATVINMSLGGTGSSTAAAVTYETLFAEGILSIAAAGNKGNDRYAYPASYDAVVSVAAVAQTLVVARFSQRTDQVELAAPGVGVLSSTPRTTETSLLVDGVPAGAKHVKNAAYGAATGAVVYAGLCDGTMAQDLTGYIALCARGQNTFYDKVRRAEARGAAAVLIANNDPGPLTATLGDHTSAIPAVTISQEAGGALAHLLAATAALDTRNDYPTNDYEAWNGTSMATPHVAGVAALLWSRHPNASAAQIRAAMVATALDLGRPGRDDLYGHGLVQAAAADLQLELCDSRSPVLCRRGE